MRLLSRSLLVLTFLHGTPLVAGDADDSARPNIVFILADDLGLGDLGCYNADSKIPTPQRLGTLENRPGPFSPMSRA